MIKRPMTAGAVLLVMILVIGRFAGMLSASPLLPEQEEEIQVLGRICFREQTSQGTRLYLDSNSILSKSSGISMEVLTDQNSGIISHPGFTQLKKDNRILVYLKADDGEENTIGSWILAAGKCSVPDTATNPGQFDSREYYKTRKVVLILKKAEIMQRGSSSVSAREYLAVCRERLSASCGEILNEREAGVLSAMITGDRAMMDEDLKRLYQEGGIAHILAISSLHISFLGRGIYRFLRQRRCSFVISSFFAALIVWSFAIMSGMSISVIRASVMFCVWLGSQMAGRTNDGMTSLSLAVCVILLNTSDYLGDASFLLSVVCVLSILCISPLVSSLLPIPGGLGKGLRMSVAIQIGTLPITMWFYYQVTPYAVIANLIVIPCMSLIMMTGLLGSIAGCISVPAGMVAGAPCYYLLTFFEQICRWERKLPGSVIITGRPGLWQVFFYYGVVAGLCLCHHFGFLQHRCSACVGERLLIIKNRLKIGFLKIKPREEKKSGEELDTGLLDIKPGEELDTGLLEIKSRNQLKAGFLLWAGLIIAMIILSIHINPEFRVTFLDVGQGDGIVIEADNHAFLIDGGSTSVDSVWQYRIESTLKYYGISNLDVVFLSHSDQDHISGTQELLENYERNRWGHNIGGITLKKLLFPDLGYEDDKWEQLVRKAKGQGIETGTFLRGGKIGTDKVTITCLYPDARTCTGDKNEDSMVLKLTYGDLSVLFTGDMGMEGEQQFLAYYREQFPDPEEESVTILKVGHHGSRYATSGEFLEFLKPKYAVISCGKNNSYGHPAPETLERLEKSGAAVLRTDLDGAVVFTE